MKLYKKTIALLMVFLLLAGSAVSESVSLFASETESDFSRSRRVISLVYDDSSSMGDLNNAKALNTAYAVENFISLLDPQADTLYVTFMSNPSTAVRIQLENGIEASWKQLLETKGCGATPVSAVETAINELKQHEGDENTSYWLIILTDGQFTDLQWYILQQQNTMEVLVKSAWDKRMPNDTYLQGCYIAIGNDAQKINPFDRMRVYPETQDGILTGDEIQQTMSTIANLVCGRTIVVPEIKDGELNFSLDLPSYHISIIDQGNQASIKRILCGNEEVKCQEANNESADSSGSLNLQQRCFDFIASEDTHVLPKGQYTIQYEGTFVNPVITAEPALQLKISASLNDDFMANVQAVLTPYQSDDPVDPALLPAQTTYSIQAVRNEQKIASSDDPSMRLDGVPLEAGTAIQATVLLGGTGGINAQRYFAGPLKLQARTLNVGAPILTTNDHMTDGSNLVTFDVEYAGKDEDLQSVSYKVETDLEELAVRPGIDGKTVSLYSTQTEGFFLKFGEYPVRIIPESDKVVCIPTEIQLHVGASMLTILLLSGILLLLLLLLIGLICRRRFPKNSSVTIQGGGLSQTKRLVHSFPIPFVRDRMTVGGYHIHAGSQNAVMLLREQIPMGTTYVDKRGNQTDTIAVTQTRENAVAGERKSVKTQKYVPLTPMNDLVMKHGDKTIKMSLVIHDKNSTKR